MSGKKQRQPQPCGGRTGPGALFAQPPAGLYGRASIYQCGGELEVENFKELLDYREGSVRIRLGRGVLTVTGDGLELAALEKHRLRLKGLVLKTEFSYDGGGDGCGDGSGGSSAAGWNDAFHRPPSAPDSNEDHGPGGSSAATATGRPAKRSKNGGAGR